MGARGPSRSPSNRPVMKPVDPLVCLAIDFDDAALREWNRINRALAKRGTLTENDRSMMEQAARSLSLYEHFISMVKDVTLELIDVRRVNSLALDHQRTYRDCLRQLRLTEAMRADVAAEIDDGETPQAKILGFTQGKGKKQA